jgi:hypothetical protein
MVMTDPDVRRRRISLALLLVIAVLGVLTFRYASSTASATSALKASDELAGCRAEFRNLVDVAEGERDDADGARADLFLQGLIAATAGTDEDLAAIVAAIPAVAADLDAARGELVDARRQYGDAVALSRSDPERFLAICRDRFPT